MEENKITQEQARSLVEGLGMKCCTFDLERVVKLTDKERVLITKIYCNTPYKSIKEILNIIEDETYEVFYGIPEAFEKENKEVLDALKDYDCSDCFDFTKWLEKHNDEYFKCGDEIIYIEKAYVILTDAGREIKVTKEQYELYDDLCGEEQAVIECYLDNYSMDNFDEAYKIVKRGDYLVCYSYEEIFEEEFPDIYSKMGDYSLLDYFDFESWADDDCDIHYYNDLKIRLFV